MFTGIVEEVGTVESLGQQEGGWRLALRGPLAARGTALGQSVAVSGACLTVIEAAGERLAFGLAPETLARTNLGDLRPGDPVNLERALAANGRFDGHIVQGHIDGTGTLAALTPDGDSLRVRIAAPPALLRYIVPKGFIAVDGASLTVIDVLPDAFTFMLIAYSRAHLALPRRPLGCRVNIELDILAKYVEKLVGRGQKVT
jgi:riboflavin synthase